MIVQICVGSSCHLKGSQAIVEMLQQAISDNHLDNDVTLAGSFCTGKCNRYGVTITVDDEIYTGIPRENVSEFIQKKILSPIQATGV